MLLAGLQSTFPSNFKFGECVNLHTRTQTHTKIDRVTDIVTRNAVYH